MPTSLKRQNLVSRSDLALYGGRPVRDKPLPFMHPGAGFIDDEEIDSVVQVLKSQSLFRYYGPRFLHTTEKFEEEFARYIGVKYALAVTSGTAALHTALVGLGVEPKDEVILPTYAWVSCPSAIIAAGGIPVLADIDDTLTLNPQDVESKITNNTKAIMAVHIRGVACDLDALKKICERYQVRLLEDVAQAAGGSFHGRKLGSIGHVSSYSFQLNKMISAGEGGVVATDDETIYERAFMFHDTATPYRRTASSIKPFPGVNYRMNEVSSAIMRVQLRKLDGIVERLRKNKEKIKRGISDIPQISFRRIPDPEGEVAICIVFYVESAEKAREFRDALVAENIRTESGGYPGILYDANNPRDGHVFLNWRHILKNGELLKKRYQKSIEIMERAVHIDVSPLLTEDDIEDVIEAVHKIASAVL